MPSVYLVLPIAFEVEKKLFAWAKDTGTNLKLYDPKTMEEIRDKLINTYEIGLIIINTPESVHKLGFATPNDIGIDKSEIVAVKREFPWEAMLVLEEGDTWVIELGDNQDFEVYRYLAEALKNKFGVSIRMIPEFMDNLEELE